MRTPKPERPTRVAKPPAEQAQGACVCGAVRFEIDIPAVWAWHDHSPASRRAQGCAYATYVGSWRSKFRFLEGEEYVARYQDPAAGTVRSFCRRCGAPLTYERPRAPKVVNIPRALFEGRTGREPRYHLDLAQAADWTYMGEPLSPLKNYPGVMWERPKRRKRRAIEPMF